MCTQNGVQCTVRAKRLPPLKLQQTNDTLSKAVHALYEMYKPCTVGSYTDVTTETILQRLGLSEQTSPEGGFVSTQQDMECTTGLETSLARAPEPSTSDFEVDANGMHVDLTRPSMSLSSGTSSSPCTDQYRSSSAMTPTRMSFSTESSWDSVATTSSANNIEASMSSLTCLQKSPLLYSPGSVKIDSAIHNDFDLFFGPVAGRIPAGSLTAIEDEFGFDPPTWRSAPGAGSRVTSTSVCADMGSYTPQTLWTPRCRRTENPQDVAQNAQPTAQPSPRTLPNPRRRPGRPRNASRLDRDKPASEADKREILLEKNRLAASKCREKKKAEVDALKDASAASKEENSLLKKQATELREEILHLREELFAHVVCVEYCEQEKWRVALGATGRESILAS
ncbi:uncharacterized protein AB675_380 [Cyphellophora attinorum]|uniref:BZIP domain-containing protein n=1 Tax=Cyphellophora attinorum TaxID=1664694 RepID=A0A0N0NS76_9EURO|nr:uncharacterized protein AB675_380 [Phialophora attinorum]KPI45931.1 hypothetical protein AB675_380 [Phialophora attinorum]